MARDGDWETLFDGEDLDRWATTGAPAEWPVVDGAVVCEGTGGNYLHTRETYEDFELDLEFALDPGANSGVFVRWSELSAPVHTGMEIQLLDTPEVASPGRRDCGALYDMLAPASNPLRPAGEWNRLRISCHGPYVAERLNGVHVLSADVRQWDTPGRNPDGTENKFENAWADLPPRGHVGLQDHGDRVRFRSVRIRTYDD